MRKISKQLTSCLLAATLAAVPACAHLASDATVAEAASVSTLTTSPARVSVHDPSIMEAADGTYYAFGSHIDAAKSTDLVNWTRFTNGYDAKNNALFGDLSKNLAKPFKWAGENDCDSKASGFSVWAPDAFYNKDYVNEDGSKGAYMMYFCTTSTYKRSVIAFGVSQKPEGPYTCVDTLVYSGFTKNEAYDYGSNIDTHYTNTNISELIENGTLKDGVNDEWFLSGATAYNTSYAPNAIDPTLFYDKTGKLWMTYGSWSGGIFILQIDPATGKAIYPGKNSVTADGLVVDEYFGTRISGGYTKSGEAPYILYDSESDYYYLYVTYESLNADGGYNMRLFRSKSPDGPYLDAAGNNAALTERVDNTGIGIKVMGNHKFSCYEKAYKAPSHNSAFIDEDGKRYLIYHTRFSDSGEFHQLRVHQQFLNEEGWPVTAVFENKGDEISKTGYSMNDIAGEYEFVNHGTKNDMGNVTNATDIKLNADGTISGSVTGTWTVKDNTCYMSAVIDGVTYSGVFFAQHDESEACNKVMTFTAIGTNNMTIWGVKKDLYNIPDTEAVANAVSELVTSNIVPEKTLSDIILPADTSNGAKVTWSSSFETVIANDGKVTRPSTAQEVTLTANVTYGSATEKKTFTTTVMPAEILPDYKYDFETVSGTEVADSGTSGKSATLNGSASVAASPLAGNVLEIKNSKGEQGKNYLALPSTMFSDVNTSGFTVSMWVKTGSSASEESALFEAKSSATYDSLPSTSLCAGIFADFKSHEATAKGSIGLVPEPGEWSYITYTVASDGVKVFVNGDPRNNNDINLAAGLASNVISQINDIRIGSGTLASDEDVADASFDDIEFYSVALDSATIASKYNAVKDSHPNIKLTSSKSTIYAGGDTANTSKLSIETGIDYTVMYNSSDSSVASVDETGSVTANKAGTATITAVITVNGETFDLTKKITVKKASLKFSKKTSSIKVKKSSTFKVKGSGVKTSNVKWTSSKPSVLSINSKGKATGKKAGTAKITAKCGKFKVSVKVKVKK